MHRRYFISCKSYKSSLCIEFRPACVCVLVLEFRFLEIPGELGVVAGFSMHDWESRDDEMFLLFEFALDDIEFVLLRSFKLANPGPLI